METGKPIRMCCPACRTEDDSAAPLAGAPWRCPSCGFVIEIRDGVWRALPAERIERYRQFFKEYLAVRRAEGRGSTDAAYYLALPFSDLTGKLSGQWRMRARTWRYFAERILAPIERKSGRALKILDLGAGTGWLSYRLAERGHEPAAVDLLDDPLDGLGAARHYCTALGGEFPAVQAEFDRLPFAGAQFDLAVFNASLHYSVDYRATLQEARRCLKWGGRVVILDTPVYRKSLHGEAMRRERHDDFEQRYGFRSESVLSIEYLDEKMIENLGRDLNLEWRIHRPWYGVAWRLRPIRAKLARRRPPSRFWIFEGVWSAR